jgi:hypothetical protein
MSAARLLRTHGRTLAVLIWAGVFAAVISLLLAGRLQTISYGVYAAAGQHWLASQPLYETVTTEGFQYFPTSAMLSVPLAWLGRPLGDVVWRALWWSLYALGIWRLACAVAPTRTRECFLLATCLAVGPATGALSTGQANLAIAALMMHVCVDLTAKRYGRATAVLTFGLALKPLIAVYLLLAWALHRPLRWRLPPACMAMALTPWIVKDGSYVVAQYAACLAKLRVSGSPPGLYEDMRGLFATLGWLMPHTIYLGLRAVAALAVLALCVRAQRVLREPYAGLLTLAFAESYLMLFNPRTQTTSYAMTASVAALLAASYLLDGNRLAAIRMAIIVLAWSVNYHTFGFIEFWWKPLVCIGFSALLVRAVLMPTQAWRLSTGAGPAVAHDLATPAATPPEA